MKAPVALITGITGQDGAYLARFLLKKNYIVHGIKRRASSFNTERVDGIYQDPHEPDRRFIMHYGDMTDATNLLHLIQTIQPDEIYNLAAQSHVQVSFEMPEYTANADALGVLRLLEAIRLSGRPDRIKLLQASTSELFGTSSPPQNETTPFRPCSPYATAKLYAYWTTVNYREAYGLFAANAIAFNHESPVRGETFVTRKITRAVAAIYHGFQEKLYLGNLDAVRDWGHAGDYAEGLWKILQHSKPDNFVLATGIGTSVRDFVKKAFQHININLVWQGSGINEKGFDAVNRRVLVEIDPRYFRPSETGALIGDSSKARRELGWAPTRTIDDLVASMVESDLKIVPLEQTSQDKYRDAFI